MATKIISALGVAAFNAAVAAEIALGNSPVGVPQYTLYQAYPEKWTISISIAVGNDSVTAYSLLSATSPSALTTLVNTAITGGFALAGGHAALASQQNTTRATYFQATYKGAAVDAGLGASSAPNVGSVTGLTAALAAKADLVTGTVPVAQLPVATSGAKGIASFGTGMTVTAGAVTVP